MKVLLIGSAAIVALAAAGSAGAADIPSPAFKAPPAVIAPAYNWTGFYVGVHAGAIWLRSTDTITAANGAPAGLIADGRIATSLPLNSSGFIGGGQLGHNWQVDRTRVLGVEADPSGTGLSSTVSLPGPTDATRIMTASEKLDWFGTVRGPIGVTPWDRALLYFKGGLA